MYWGRHPSIKGLKYFCVFAFSRFCKIFFFWSISVTSRVSQGGPRCPRVAYGVSRWPTVYQSGLRWPKVDQGSPEWPVWCSRVASGVPAYGVPRWPTVPQGGLRCPKVAHGVPEWPKVAQCGPRFPRVACMVFQGGLRCPSLR